MPPAGQGNPFGGENNAQLVSRKQQVSRKGAKDAMVAKSGSREICSVAMLTGNAIWTIIYALVEERS